MSMDEMLRVVDHQYVPTNIEAIKAVFLHGRRDDRSIVWALATVYNYGVIMGKREERARRNRKTA